MPGVAKPRCVTGPLLRALPLGMAALLAAIVWMATSSISSLALAPPSPPRALEKPGAAEPLSPIFARPVLFWANDIRRWAAAYGLDPNLVATVMQIESCGDPGAVSPSGAMGLFQVMGFHFPAQENALDPETNARRGLDYLQLGLDRAGGSADLAFAGYNGGHGRIGQEPRLWPAETQRYVYWASGIYADARAGHTSSTRLSEWMRAGGASLCRRAASAVGISY